MGSRAAVPGWTGPQGRAPACAGAERPQGNAVLTFGGSQADLHVNRALIREESAEERENQSLLWSLGLLTIRLTPI